METHDSYLLVAPLTVFSRFLQVLNHIFFPRRTPHTIKQPFKNRCFMLWLMFATSQISTLQDTILKIEKDNISATEDSWCVNLDKSVMKSKYEEVFMPSSVNRLSICLQEGEISVQEYTIRVTDFYKTLVDYLEK